MKLKNKKVIGIEVEERGSRHNARSQRINDKLSWEVSNACDAFFEKRGLVKNFKDAWFAYHNYKGNQ
jgi:hypothetical protein